MNAIKVLPDYDEALQKKYGGQQAAIVDRQFVAFGRDSIEAMEKAKQQGYTQDEVLLCGIPRLGAIYA